jgi:hypothetical protein
VEPNSIVVATTAKEILENFCIFLCLLTVKYLVFLDGADHIKESAVILFKYTNKSNQYHY